METYTRALFFLHVVLYAATILNYECKKTVKSTSTGVFRFKFDSLNTFKSSVVLLRSEKLAGPFRRVAYSEWIFPVRLIQMFPVRTKTLSESYGRRATMVRIISGLWSIKSGLSANRRHWWLTTPRRRVSPYCSSRPSSPSLFTSRSCSSRFSIECLLIYPCLLLKPSSLPSFVSRLL